VTALIVPSSFRRAGGTAACENCQNLSMGVTKKQAAPEVVAAIDNIESRADECYKTLELLQLPANLATWALLTGAVGMVEREIKQSSDDSPRLSATLRNLSLFVPIAIRWTLEHGQPASQDADLRWTPQLGAAGTLALHVASQYSHFAVAFPMWHRDRYSAQLLSQDAVRFTAPGSQRHRQVSAHLKGFRPKHGVFRAVMVVRPKMPEVTEALFALSLQGALMTGYKSFKYQEPWTLWRELLPEYRGRVDAMSRRNDALSMGDYTLAEFKQFYAAFLAICAGHEFLCFAWGKQVGVFPFGSAIMIRSHNAWEEVISELGGLSRQVCSSIICDLSLTAGKSQDLHVSPFVPLGTGQDLAVAPQFPLHSQAEENILRICSNLRPAIYQAMSDEKERDMLVELKERLKHRDTQGPISLPNPVPDIDLLIKDESSSTLVLCELKWNRKSLSSKEIISRDAEVLKGISQLDKVKQYLLRNPERLTRQKTLLREFTEYRHVYYLLVPRDHWLWIDPTDDTAIVEFEVFAKVMGGDQDLPSAVRLLLTYEWLPVEGRDFTVRYERATVNGVSMESQIFHAT
jgi:hypothetical protein